MIDFFGSWDKNIFVEDLGNVMVLVVGDGWLVIVDSME